MTDTSTRVRVEHADGVAVLHLDDGKANVLSPEMQREFDAGLTEAEDAESVVVIAGRPGVFSGGFDLATLRDGGGAAARMLEGGFALAMRMLDFPSPIVIACTGHAIAMGSFVLLSADYRVAARGPFKIVANEVAIGMTLPWTAIEICRYRLAPAHFYRAVNLAEIYTPEAAVAAGWVDEVVDPDDVVTRATGIAQSYTTLHRAAHAATKARSRASAQEAIALAFAKDSEEFRAIALS